MTESVFSKRTVKSIYKEIQTVYLNDSRPWILGYSGGKDSTCMVQLVWNALSKLPVEKLDKKIYIVSSDTLVESPQIVKRITFSLDKMEKASKKSHIPISTNLLRPPISDTFWVRILGLGYPAPTSMFRWCTDLLKIANADRFIKERVSEYGEVIVLLGTRKSESSTRQQSMNMLEIENSVLSHHKKFAQTYVYTPLVDFETDDVWNYLLQVPNLWGDNNRDLLALYQDANASECPLVVDTSTPSCGSGRFGCWTCTVVDKQKSLDSMIENGHEWMEPLAELRYELKKTQDPKLWPKIRQITRRNGLVELKTNGTDYTPGPYTLQFRKEYLTKLLEGQVKIQKHEPDMILISEDEIHEIQKIWRMEDGDWQNTAYLIYHDIIGVSLESPIDNMGGFGLQEQEILKLVCDGHNVPYKLVSRLLNSEFELQNNSNHAKIFEKIKKILSKEWRDDIDEIRKDLFAQLDENNQVKPNAFK
ncbi:MAG: DNA phosphorothioation system sulfurtransferase DndC [Candidatus Nitrosoabyssus spongiisocia]|nr:MAG: DNA phosphorothioation system sulfurtransferase DndC [Nitrosopumilaceae archaeon AB1(1)]